MTAAEGNELPGEESFVEPTGGDFRALLTRWKNQDTDNCSAMYTPRKDRIQARQSFHQRCSSGEFSTSSSARKKALRQPMNVYQKPISSIVLGEEYQPPSFAHTPEDQAVILQALQNNFCFSGKSVAELQLVVAAFEKCSFPANHKIISQGELGDYFYVLQCGTVQYLVDDVRVGQTDRTGASFGELALLYTTPRAATVVAVTDTSLFRVDQTAFRSILQAQTEKLLQQKMRLLANIDFLKGVPEQDLKRLSAVMRLRLFSKNQTLLQKGMMAEFWIIQQGTVVVDGVDLNETLHVGDYFGEQALRSNDLQSTSVVAMTNGVAFTICPSTFEKVLGTLSDLVRRSRDVQILSDIPVIQSANLTQEQLRTLASLVTNKTFSVGSKIFRENGKVSPAVYIVRKGQVQIESSSEHETHLFSVGSSFGTDLLRSCSQVRCGPSMVTSRHTAIVVQSPCVCGVLTLRDCRAVFDPDSSLPTSAPCLDNDDDTESHSAGASDSKNIDQIEEILATPPPAQNESTTAAVAEMQPPSLAKTTKAKKKRRTPTCTSKGVSITKSKISNVPERLEDVQRHLILGEGTFGQVWLASNKCGSKPCPFAIKIQSKHQLVLEGQGETAIREKETMQELKHPFIIKLLRTYQDKDYLYSAMELVQGGELFSLMYMEQEKVKLPEAQAKFYAFGIADALAFMHCRQYVYRDLKPENIMIDRSGYPILIDLGFAKKVLDKTYTLCGTPG
jgi:CRP-like cAMP-binding protein